MKVLMLHNKYKIMGGEDVSTEAEYNLLKSNGIDIEMFYVNNNALDKLGKLKLAANTIWSNTYYKEIYNKVKNEKFDLVHIQNFFPLFSPSIFYAAHNAGAKIVMSVRNYRMICPNALMYVNNNICTDCVGKTVPYPALAKKCYRESFSATGATVAMMGIHNMLNTWKKNIDGFICISEFVKNQLIEGNFNTEKLFVKYNFVKSELEPDYNPEDYYIYVGRISVEKGIDVILEEFEKNKKELYIIGDGPLRYLVEEASQKNPNIKFLGKLSLPETYKKISKAKALIFPSKWHEPFGRTIVESFAHGTPVLGSALGGVTELIKDGYNGYLFDPHHPSSLHLVIDQFEKSNNSMTMRQNSYDSYINNFHPSSNFSQLSTIYQKVLSK